MTEGGGGCTNACICMGKQSAFTTEPLNGCLRNLVGMKCSWLHTWIKMFSAISANGWIQGEAKIGHWGWGSPSSQNFFFRLEGYSNKPKQ